MLQSRTLGDIGERAVAVVLEEMTAGLLACGKPFEPPSIDQEDILPAVVVVVVEREPAAGSFEEIFIGELAAVDGLDVKAGLGGDIDEADAKRCAFDG
jgi:hypothetical protein